MLTKFLQVFSDWAVPALIFVIPVYALFRGVKVYEAFVEGAKEGFDVAVRIMPYLVAILVAIGMFRDVTAMDIFNRLLGPITNYVGMPAELLPMALIRPLSGSGALGVMNSIFLTSGPDSYAGLMASVMMGSTETTFYVLTVYFGSVNLRKTRHAVAAGLIGDFAGLAASVILCNWAFGELMTK
ncbi:spore maturation protein [bacterium]|nr:spore maturation protein [bacterium]